MSRLPLWEWMGYMEQELDSLSLPFMAKSVGPPWLPGPAADARQVAYWAQWVLVVFGLIWIIIGIVSVVFGQVVPGVYGILSGIVDFLLLFIMRSSFFDTLDQGRFREASDRLIIWMIIGLIFGIFAGIFLIIAYFKLQQVFQPQYQPYPAGQYQASQAPQQPPQVQAPPPRATPAPQPPPQQPTQAQPEQPKHTEMVKCKKCGVQYPAFMRTCPNCNEPR